MCCILFLFFNLLTSRTLSLYSTGATGWSACLSVALSTSNQNPPPSLCLSTYLPLSCLSTLTYLSAYSYLPTPSVSCTATQPNAYTVPSTLRSLLQPNYRPTNLAAGPLDLLPSTYYLLAPSACTAPPTS